MTAPRMQRSTSGCPAQSWPTLTRPPWRKTNASGQAHRVDQCKIPLTSRAAQSLGYNTSTPGATGRLRLAHGPQGVLGIYYLAGQHKTCGAQCPTWEGPSKVVPRPGRDFELTEQLHAQVCVQCGVTLWILHIQHCSQKGCRKKTKQQHSRCPRRTPFLPSAFLPALSTDNM